MSQKTKKTFADEFLADLYEGIEAMRAGKKLTRRTVNILPAPETIAKDKIIDLRKNKLGVSQCVFAQMLNVNCHTVQAWEQGWNKPKGVALRFFQVIEQHPNILLNLIAAQQSQTHYRR
jgi:putative transcriptional regulator